MFLQQLSYDERRAFDALAKVLIASDGNLAPEEARLLSQLRVELGFGDDPPADARSVTELASVFGTHRGRRIALLELLGIAHADGELHSSESEFLRQIARAWGVSEVELLTLENWTLRMLAVAGEAEALLTEKD